MNIKMELKYLLTISLAIFLSACNNPNNSVPIQSDSGGYDNDYNSEYQNAPITNTPRYSKSNKSYGEPVVVVNKHYYQSKPKVRVSRYKRK